MVITGRERVRSRDKGVGGGYSGFQVMGMIEEFFGGLKFSIPGFFWVGKFGK